MLLNGTPDQKKKLIREYLTGESESSSGDDFEKEMEAELSSTIKTMEGTWGPPAPGSLRFLPQHLSVVLSVPRGDGCCSVLQENLAGAAAGAAALSPTPGCTTRCTSTRTQRKRTSQVGARRPLMTSPRAFCIVSTVTKTRVRPAGSSTGRRLKQRMVKSNDELLYDPDEDDRDQAWVDARRRR